MAYQFTRLLTDYEALRLAALNSPELSGTFLAFFEEAFGKVYHGHTVLDAGVVSIFMTDPKSCVTRCSRTHKLHETFNDKSVSAALLDVDQNDNPLTLDIYPLWVIGSSTPKPGSRAEENLHGGSCRATTD